MQRIITENRDKIIELCKTHHVRRLSVFGSAVRDDFDPAMSDLDMLVEFDESGDFRYAPNFFELQKLLAATLARKVDLVIADTVRNSIVLHNIKFDEKVLYAA